jgi:hypothetical protein
MAKKSTFKVEASISVDPSEKASAWLTKFSIIGDDSVTVVRESISAWKNASAAKRWIKAQVLAHTPRKSVKMVAGETLDVKGKPVSFTGELFYKA